MKNIQNSNYIYREYEEKKENIFDKNDTLYNNLQLDGIINDLKKKGFNDFQIKDIISSIEKNNNFLNNKIKNYKSYNIEDKFQNINHIQENKIKDYNSFKNEPEKKQRNEYNKYNTKIYISNNVNEIRHKILNDDKPKKKFSEKINYQITKPLLVKIKNESLIENTKIITKRNNFIQNYNFSKSRNIINAPLRGIKNNFNNYSFYDSNKKNANKKEINNSKNNIQKNNSYRLGKITKYTNKKFKKIIIDDGSNNIKKEYFIIKIPSTNQISERLSPENRSNFNLNRDNIEVKNDDSFNGKNNIYKDYLINSNNNINRQKCIYKNNHKLYFTNNKKNYQTVDNKNTTNIFNKINNTNIDYENSNLKTEIKNENINNKYNNYNYHDICSQPTSYKKLNNCVNNIKHNYNNNKSIDISEKNILRNEKYKNKKIDNSAKNLNIIKPFNKIDNSSIKLYKNKKKLSYNNISQKFIYDLNQQPKKIDLSHNNIRSLNIAHNTISISIEPSKKNKDKKIFKNSKIQNENNFEIKNYNLRNINLKARNKSENKQLLTIDNKNELNFISNKKHYRDGLYEGIIINGKREKKGKMKYKKGGIYDGEWKNDKRHGKGIFVSQNFNTPGSVGIKYEGEFNNDKIEGYGIGKYSSGDQYEGEWKNDQQYGRGILNYVGGGKYEGEWKFGKLNGEGIYFLKNGERFEGKFIDNKYNGYGKYYYINGDYLEGIFKDDLPTGDCILHKPDGTTENRHYN